MASQKTLIFTILLLFTTMELFGQVPLKPLYEEFTSSTCGPCAPANAILDPLLEQNSQTHNSLRYQMDFPGDGDPYHIADNDIRFNFYNTGGAPSLYINGNIFNNILSIDQTDYDSFLGESSFIEIIPKQSLVSSSKLVEVNAEVKALQNYAAGLKLHVILTEALTYDNVGTNGEELFHDVAMAFLTEPSGEELMELESGEVLELNYNFDASNTNIETANDLRVVIFIQDDTDRSIIQSEVFNIDFEFEEYKLSVDVKDTEGNIIEDANFVLQGNGPMLSDSEGLVFYENILDGTYTYTISKPGFLDNTGEIVIDGGDAEHSVVMELPDFFFFEDFSVQQPVGWIGFGTLPAAIIWGDGQFTFFNSTDTSELTYLVSPIFDLSSNMDGQIVFNLERQFGSPTGSFGMIADQNDFSTSLEYTPISLSADSEPTDFIYDLSDIEEDLSNIQFYWSIDNIGFSVYVLNYFYITEGTVSSTENNALSEISVYPNPSKEYLFFKTDLQISEINLFDSFGNLVVSENNLGGDVNMNISHLNSGYYFVSIKTAYGTKVMVIMKE